ncbi:hypothetical protein MMC13_005078 [Lambiella insularis]|nr:hypothetical protein [Lambiella insularis]
MAADTAQGYLRTGQVLQLMGKHETALGIYEYGLKNVPANHESFKLLRGMCDNIARKCASPGGNASTKVLDPLEVLPLELVHIILQHLSFKTVVCILRVSKRWKSILESIPALWRHLDLSKTTKNVRFTAIKYYVIRSRGTLTRATLTRYDSANSDALTYIASRCKQLEYLELRVGLSNESLIKAAAMAPSLKTLILVSGHQVSLDTVTQLLEKSKSLEHAEFHILAGGNAVQWSGDLSRLRVLKLHIAKESRRDMRLELVSHVRGSNPLKANSRPEMYLLSFVQDTLFPLAPNLHELSLSTRSSGSPRIASDFSSLTQLRILSLTDIDILTFPCLPHSLRSLTMVKAWGIGSRSALNDAYMARNDFSALTHLTVSAARFLLPEAVTALIGSGKNKLQKLDLRDHDSRLGIAALISEGHLSEVEELRLSDVDLSDQLAELIARSCPRLKSFDASYNLKLTGVGVKALVLKEGEALKRLELDHCAGVGIDAVEFARAKGVVVGFTFPDNLKYGRRLRMGRE